MRDNAPEKFDQSPGVLSILPVMKFGNSKIVVILRPDPRIYHRSFRLLETARRYFSYTLEAAESRRVLKARSAVFLERDGGRE